MRCLDGIIDSMDMSFSKPGKIVKDREAWRGAVHGVRHNLATEPQQQFGRVLNSWKTKLNLVCPWVFRLRFLLSTPVLKLRVPESQHVPILPGAGEPAHSVGPICWGGGGGDRRGLAFPQMPDDGSLGSKSCHLANSLSPEGGRGSLTNTDGSGSLGQQAPGARKRQGKKPAGRFSWKGFNPFKNYTLSV